MKKKEEQLSQENCEKKCKKRWTMIYNDLRKNKISTEVCFYANCDEDPLDSQQNIIFLRCLIVRIYDVVLNIKKACYYTNVLNDFNCSIIIYTL